MSLLNYLETFPKNVELENLKILEEQRQQWWQHKGSLNYLNILNSLPEDLQFDQFSITDGHVDFQKSSPLSKDQEELIAKAAQELIPWKKGPFQFANLELDAEWRSDQKWDRVKSFLPSLENKKVLDIGCNNGYFLYQMLALNPDLLLGIDPVIHYASQFKFLEKFHRDPRMHFKLWGVEHLSHFHSFFDLIFSMGIIYHHRNPIAQLVDIRNALTPGGTVILETIGIPGDEQIALFPEDRYAKMKNVWFIPTLSCFKNWAAKAKFIDIEIISDTLLTPKEQRLTNWCPPPHQSLENFLDPNDPSLTIEGLPAPRRFCLKARKKKGS